MRTTSVALSLAFLSALPLSTLAADTHRQADVVQRGTDVMPFDVQASQHIFTKTTDGGIQRVVAKNVNDATTTKFVRSHLQKIRQEFLAGDFAGPAHIHGEDMPGLADLRAAKSGQISIEYRDVKGGAELVFRTPDPALVAALHKWFDAQLSDHGSDAMEGHSHYHADMPGM